MSATSFEKPWLRSIQVGMPRQHGDIASDDPMQRAWVTGFYKLPVQAPVAVRALGLSGDGQADLQVHGGVDKALLGYAESHYEYWKERLGRTELPHGAFGENLTLVGCDESTICIGDQWSLGDCVIEVSQPRQPCWKLGRRWQEKMLPKWVVQTGWGGWYFRVLVEGTIEAGMSMELLDRPNPQWTIARANDCMYGREIDSTALMELNLLPQLSHSWKQSLG